MGLGKTKSITVNGITITREDVQLLEGSLDRDFGTLENENKADRVIAKLYELIGDKEEAARRKASCDEADRALIQRRKK